MACSLSPCPPPGLEQAGGQEGFSDEGEREGRRGGLLKITKLRADSMSFPVSPAQERTGRERGGEAERGPGSGMAA